MVGKFSTETLGVKKKTTLFIRNLLYVLIVRGLTTRLGGEVTKVARARVIDTVERVTIRNKRLNVVLTRRRIKLQIVY